jgi:phosphatidylinositol-3-phosphatase
MGRWARPARPVGAPTALGAETSLSVTPVAKCELEALCNAGRRLLRCLGSTLGYWSWRRGRGGFRAAAGACDQHQDSREGVSMGSVTGGAAWWRGWGARLVDVGGPACRRAVGASLAALVALGALGGGSAAATAPDPCGSLAGPPTVYSHVVVIMDENLSYSKAIGNPNAPYLNMLASDCALATNFHNETHPSQPNYMAATSGVASGVSVHTSNPSIYQQVATWTDLEESMASPCGGTATHYKRGHDPAYWYTQIAAACKADDVPMAPSDAGATSLPSAAFTWITPNQCHNHHWQTGCTEQSTSTAFTQAMDRWLSGTIQAIQATPDYQAGKTLIFVTFDEGQGGTTGENCAEPTNTDPSCHVVTIAIAAGVHHVEDPTFYTHYSMLRSAEQALGITTYLGNAATANDMRPGMGF